MSKFLPVAVFGACAVSILAQAGDVKITGDVRYRYESIDDETQDPRARERIRARLGIESSPAEGLTLAAGLATGSLADPVSTNQTFDDAASKKGLNLDYAYADWRLGEVGSLIAGKMKNPFFMPAKSSLVWDHDLTPEGIAFKWAMGGEGSVKPFVTVTRFIFDERYSGGVDSEDAWMLGLQAGVKAGGLTAGVSLFSFDNLEGFAPLGNGAEGNTLSGGNYATEFSTLEVFVEWSAKLGPKEMPLTLGLDYVTNTAASDLNTGFLFAVSVGKCKDPGSWSVSLDYRSLEADCVLGTWTDSDHFDGGTNGTGIGVNFSYQMAKNSTLGITYLMDTKDPDGAATSYNRLQVDLAWKF